MPVRISAVRILFILFCCCSCIHAHAQKDYYLYNSKTSKKHLTSNQLAIDLNDLARLSLKPGDRILINIGDTFQHALTLSNIHGTKERPVFIGSANAGRACIEGNNFEAIVLMNCSNIILENINATGSGRKTGNTTNGISCSNCSSIVVKNIDVSGFQKSGLLLYNCVNMVVDSVVAHDNGSCGILVEGDYQKRISCNIHIVNCQANNNPGDPTNLDNHSGNGILAGNCKNVLIEYCSATNNGWDMPRIGNGPVGIWAYEADSVTIQHCISYRNKTAKGAADGGGFDLDGGVTNSVVQYCLSYENQGSGYGIYEYYSASKWNNNTVRYCISINDGQVTDQATAMYIWNGWNGDSTFTNFYAYNNLFINQAKYALSFHELNQHKQFYFYNNIFVSADTADMIQGTDSSRSDVFINNVWMKEHGGFSENGFTKPGDWAKATGYEMLSGACTAMSFDSPLFNIEQATYPTDPHLLTTDIFLKSLYNLKLRNKGFDLLKMFGIHMGSHDFFGNKIRLGKNYEPGVAEIK